MTVTLKELDVYHAFFQLLVLWCDTKLNPASVAQSWLGNSYLNLGFLLWLAGFLLLQGDPAR